VTVVGSPAREQGSRHGLPLTSWHEKGWRVALSGTDKKQTIESHRLHEQDTGSADVQIAVLSERISRLSKHLSTHQKDFHSQRGLLKMVGRRRNLLRYLERTDFPRYKSLIEKLGLRK